MTPLAAAWRRRLQVGLGLLGLTPSAFWTMSLVEWRAACEGYAERHGVEPSSAPMARGELETLMRQFPDEERGA